MGIGWKDSEYVGLSGSSLLMQNGLGIGAGGECGKEDRGEDREVSVVRSVILMSLSADNSRDIKRQGNYIPLPTPTRKHRYFIFTWLPFAIIS